MAESDKKKLMLKIQGCSFAVLESVLYLDSHPTCPNGLAYFAKHKAELETLTAEYEEKYGPLTALASNGDKKWDWVTSPFPWERSEN